MSPQPNADPLPLPPLRPFPHGRVTPGTGTILTPLRNSTVMGGRYPILSPTSAAGDSERELFSSTTMVDRIQVGGRRGRQKPMREAV